MRYRITTETGPIVTELCRLVDETRHLLGLASAGARHEWDVLRRQFPSNEDVRQGFVSHSAFELATIRSGLQRFRETLQGA